MLKISLRKACHWLDCQKEMQGSVETKINIFSQDKVYTGLRINGHICKATSVFCMCTSVSQTLV